MELNFFTHLQDRAEEGRKGGVSWVISQYGYIKAKLGQRKVNNNNNSSNQPTNKKLKEKGNTFFFCFFFVAARDFIFHLFI